MVRLLCDSHLMFQACHCIRHIIDHPSVELNDLHGGLEQVVMGAWKHMPLPSSCIPCSAMVLHLVQFCPETLSKFLMTTSHCWVGARDGRHVVQQWSL